MYDLVIKGGTVVTAVATFTADIGINGKTIAAIGQSLDGREVLDATGKLVTPGAVGMHVHLQWLAHDHWPRRHGQTGPGA